MILLGPYKLLDNVAMVASQSIDTTILVPCFGANAILLVAWDSGASVTGTITVNFRWRVASGLAVIEGSPIDVVSGMSKITGVADLRTGGTGYILPTTGLGANMSALLMAQAFNPRVNRDATVVTKNISLWAYVVWNDVSAIAPPT